MNLPGCRLAGSRRSSHNRGMNRFLSVAAALVLLFALARPAATQDALPDTGAAQSTEAPAEAQPEVAQPTEPPAPIYDAKLLRLSEILGALSFLRDLCGDSDGPAWRNEMNALLEAEKPAPQRRNRLIARFNHGFETFNAVYRYCTPSAELSIARYLKEGEALASDVRNRYRQ
jgi:uncharacterized protein (TIGR02301 family)